MSENEKDINSLYSKYTPYLKKICLYKLRDYPDEIDDCMQETFEALLVAKENGEVINNPKSWLSVVLNNIIIDFIRTKHADREKNERYIAINSPTVPFYDIIDELDEEQIRLYKQQIIEKLEPDERELLYDKFTLDKSITQLAEEHNTTENNIYQKLFRLKCRTMMIIEDVLSRKDKNKR